MRNIKNEVKNNGGYWERECLKCGDCFAHYPIGNLHICDPLMKALVTRKRMLDDNAEMTNFGMKPISPSFLTDN
jgi:hypothetical protein